MYQERCEILTALVVQLEGEAVSLFFLRLQDEHGFLAPGSLQSIEHAIECPGQFANFRIRRNYERALFGLSSPDSTNGAKEAEERAEAGTPEQHIHHQPSQGSQDHEG